MSEPPSKPCPKCGSVDRVSGAVHSYNGWSIQFQLIRPFFSWPKPAIKVSGLVCTNCGHLELMVDPDRLKS